ncbi:MAG: rhodanese-like domain-containing protein [Burkholderiaceae bacterium]
MIAYDTPGLYSAARVWWLFRHYGYDNVSILDGGLKQWKAEGRRSKRAPSTSRQRASRPAGRVICWLAGKMS